MSNIPKYLISFNPQDLVSLLTYYTDGQVPLDAECLSLDQHPMLNNIFRLVCKAKEWPDAPMKLVGQKFTEDLQPLEFRYEGNKTLSWDDKGTQPTWEQKPDGPKSAAE